MELEFEIDKEMDFFVVNREWTEEDRAEVSRGIAEYTALRDQGYSSAEIQARLKLRFAGKTGSPKEARHPKPAAAASVQRRSRRDSTVLTA